MVDADSNIYRGGLYHEIMPGIRNNQTVTGVKFLIDLKL
jgi:hypothetical protein